MNNTGNALLGFATGIATGALLGILFAPDTGKNTRDRLSFQLDKYKDSLQQIIDDLVEGGHSPMSAAKTEGEKVILDAIQHAERLKSEIDALQSQIDAQKRS